MDDVTKQLDYYRLDPQAALKQLESSDEGLSRQEATRRLGEYGANALQRTRREPAWLKFARQFKDLMILMLLASSGIAFGLGDYGTALVLLALALLNTVIGFVQEYKAGRVMDSLEKLVVSSARVLRDGQLTGADSAELVPGDVAYIEEGDSVPADLRLIKEDELSTNDFALTGESNPTRKFLHPISAAVVLAERQNLVFMGTTVATGRGYGVVIGTGARTELGRIASLSQEMRATPSPLQKEMAHIAKKVTQGILVLCILVLPVAIHAGLGMHAALLFAIGFACSIIPNGLPAAISTSLARAAGKLAKAKALVKKLSAVESLGATSVICTDKTGTLTKNQMTVEQFLIGRATYKVTGLGYEPKGAILDPKNRAVSAAALKGLELFFVTGAMASNAHINPPDAEHGTWYCLGDPTEGAVMALAQKAGLDPGQLNTLHPELHEFGFDSARKRMSSIRKYGDKGQLLLFVKGAPENVLERCTALWDHGHSRALQGADRSFLLKHNEQLAEQAMRNLAFAYRILPAGTDPTTLKLDEAEAELTWLGMASMIDPLRSEVPEAMEAARQAHIKVSIVTGDYAPTAKAIAVRAGLTSKPEDIVVVTGEELQALSDNQVLDLAKRGGVIFSRVAPEDKLRIVGLVQDSGQVVAVTGDGINDAPALKRADIGVAMGVTGTDVAKQAAEIVLLDDSFHTLVGTVREGRVIFQNIKKATICCFTGNAAELMVNLFSLATATALHVPLALTVIQILAIDVIAELFPVAALGGDKADSEVMREQPRNPKDHILTPRAVLDLVWCGLLIGGLAFANYLWFFERNGVSAQHVTSGSDIHMQATALTYLTLVLCLLANVLLRRSRNGLFTRYQLHNKSLWLAMLFSIFCVVNIIYNPWFTPYFSTRPLTAIDWLTAIGATALFILVREFQRHQTKHSRKAVLALQRQSTLS